MGRGGLERRDEPGRVVSGGDSATRVKTGGRGTSRGEASGGEGKEQRRFDRTHRLRPKKIEEGDWVLVYDNILDNQHRAMQKFTRELVRALCGDKRQ